MFVVTLLFGLVLLVYGADLLVAGGGRLALALRVPALVVGLTVVAFGTSAPELLVSVTAALQASTDMALANVNGSNIANIALVLGLAAMASPLTVDRMLMRREVPWLLGLQVAVPLLAWDGVLSRIDGLVLIAGGVVYNALLLYSALRGRAPPLDDELDGEGDSWQRSFGKLVVGVAILVVGAKLFVGAAEQLAYALGFSQRFVGLTVVALGTSAPEVATGIQSARKGEVELAVGNSLGSNILNISMVLGITALLTPVAITDPGAKTDMIVAIGAVGLIVPMVLAGSVTRFWGAILSLGYFGFVVAGYYA